MQQYLIFQGQRFLLNSFLQNGKGKNYEKCDYPISIGDELRAQRRGLSRCEKRTNHHWQRMHWGASCENSQFRRWYPHWGRHIDRRGCLLKCWQWRFDIGISVGDDVWIGTQCVVLDGAKIGKACLIVAGSIVEGTLPDYCIAVGIPCRVLRVRTQ